MRAVGANHEVEIHLNLASLLPLTGGPAVPHLEPGLVLPEICARDLGVEEEGDIWHLLQNVKQAPVEAAAVDGENGL